MAEAATRIERQALNLPNPYRQPLAGLEQQVALAFAEVFNVDRVGADDDFYDLGGDSLLGETLSMEIHNITGKTFQMSWFFDTGSPAKVTARLGGPGASEVKERPPIFTVHGRGGFTVPRPSFYAGLAPGQKMDMFEIPGLRGDGPSFNTVKDIAAAYIRQLEGEYPAGPVLLAAFCTGGLIALEMAAQLAAKGRPVHHMVLLDPGLPRSMADRHVHEMRAKGITVAPPPEDRRKLLGRGIGPSIRLGLVKLGTLLTLGRMTDGASERDFADENLRRWTERYFLAYFKVQDVYMNLRGRNRHRGMRLRQEPKARMRAAFQYYWPEPYTGNVDIISSETRRETFEDPNQLWLKMLPNLKAHVTVAKHSDILKAEATGTAAEMQHFFDESLKRPANPVVAVTAASRHSEAVPAE